MNDAERIRLYEEERELAGAVRPSDGRPPELAPPPAPPTAAPREPTGDEKRDEAEKRVEQHADEDWLERAYEQLGVVLRDHERFNTDAIWSLLEGYPERTHEPKAMSAVVRRGQREGLIRPTSEYVKSVRRECNSRHVRVWERV